MRARRAAAFVFMLTARATSVAAQGADLSFGTYASFLAPTGRSPLAGLSLSLAGSPGFALRLNGRTALRNTSPGGVPGHASIPPWGADIDAVFALSGAPFGFNRTGATYGFVGRGMAGVRRLRRRAMERAVAARQRPALRHAAGFRAGRA